MKLCKNWHLYEAIDIALHAHGEQVDKQGLLYILHPLYVMEIVKDRGIDYQIVAILHDVLEDTEITSSDLHMFPDYILDALKLLTHKDNETYGNYINKIVKSRDELAITIKFVDAHHNLMRLPQLKDAKERKRLAKKYLMVHEKLRKLVP